LSVRLSSIWGQLKPYLRWWCEVVVLPEVALTEKSVTGSHVT